MNRLELYYWCGFLLADGYFQYKNNKLRSIHLALGIKDKEHLLKFKTFFKTRSFSEFLVKKKYKTCRVSLSKRYYQDIIQILNFDLDQKTYNPIKLNSIKGSQDEILAFLIGFIDADGYILYQSKRKDYFLGLNLHKNWSSFLEEIKNLLGVQSNVCFYKKASRLVITNTDIILSLKNFINKNDLIHLKRKWNKVVPLYKKAEKAKDDMLKILELRNSGLTYAKIAEITGFSMNKVNYFIRKSRV